MTSERIHRENAIGGDDWKHALRSARLRRMDALQRRRMILVRAQASVVQPETNHAPTAAAHNPPLGADAISPDPEL